MGLDRGQKKLGLDRSPRSDRFVRWPGGDQPNPRCFQTEFCNRLFIGLLKNYRGYKMSVKANSTCSHELAPSGNTGVESGLTPVSP